ncbi:MULTISPECIES: dihydrolipoyl dehydrogenase family protein [unclassified Modestobacter]|uniref:dihydrolipoyl dehydrogenase family protein n=1 Tax=unclassified Modestobacter TaxID=2643866 RepID=UPI0022AACC65|nr:MULTISPECIES: FAD-dependent oxidoreductase [unclassified Modestobacter]MCZ2823237.1 FAD-dependent oxidoreductase [Modestobacter sp. VKM Ac-2981]MCZ2851482.1 FAD-dependent oxidoreductase [Modestobacter sp. VKM Ac-2982]
MTRGRTWDLLVIGGGTAGIVAATTAAALGARVLLTERERTGGDCLWTGCVPSKALLASATAAADARAAARLGVDVAGVEVDFARVMIHVKQAIATIEPVDSPETLRSKGVTVLTGDAVFTGPDRATVDGREMRFRAAVIATGSGPALPPVPGLAGVDPLTNETVWGLTTLPPRLAVLGGGPIGCELGQAFARFGAQVTVVNSADRLLAVESEEASELVTAALVRDGVDVRNGARAVEVTGDRDGGELQLADGGTVPFDRLLVAVGRRARTEGLGCAAAGVELAEDGSVVVDDALRTGNPRIRAAGDVTGGPRFTHVAGVRGSLAASNAVLGLRRRVDPVVPRVTYTSPEVASVGMSPAEGAAAGLTVRRLPHTEIDRAIAEDLTAGSATLVHDRRGRLRGATVIGPRAGESLGELTLAVRQGLRVQDVAGTTHPYPTYNDAAWNAAIADVRARLRAPVVRIALRLFVRLRAVLTDRREAQRSAR